MRPAFLLMAISALLASCHAGTAHHHRERPVTEWERILENPDRDAWQRPGQVIAALRLRPDEVVADIGAGTGYYTLRMAQSVGARGTVAQGSDGDLSHGRAE